MVEELKRQKHDYIRLNRVVGEEKARANIVLMPFVWSTQQNRSILCVFRRVCFETAPTERCEITRCTPICSKVTLFPCTIVRKLCVYMGFRDRMYVHMFL